jgi:4-aminobutyrate aminotransferase-like enzyme
MRNRPGSQHILTLQDAYHGRSLATMAASWPHPNNAFGPLQPRFTRVPHPDPYRPRRGLTPDADADLCLDLLRDTNSKGIDGGVAAIIYEPIQGNGSHNEFPENWHTGLRQLCNDNDILLIVDEVQTGFGRTGRIWASDYYGIEPDMVVFGKGVGGGFPLAGVLAKAEHAQFIAGDDQLTFGQFPISIAAGLATVRAILDDGLSERAAEHGRYTTQRLLAMQDRFDLIGDVRCPGLMVSIELVRNRETKEPARQETSEIFRRALERGVILGESRYAGLGNLIKVKPPLDITNKQLAQAIDVLEDVIEEVQKDYSNQ